MLHAYKKYFPNLLFTLMNQKCNRLWGIISGFMLLTAAATNIVCIIKQKKIPNTSIILLTYGTRASSHRQKTE